MNPRLVIAGCIFAIVVLLGLPDSLTLGLL